jgi:sugar/nucleoside kinase (ribokinase family)
MSLLVVGSTAYDTIHTPHHEPIECLGGSSTHFALAARWFTEVRLVSVVGKDFRDQDVQLLQEKGIRTEGLEVAERRDLPLDGRVQRRT